jgi:hypothetical protein
MDSKPTSIEKDKILLVEGDDEQNLFSQMLVDLGLEKNIQIFQAGGISKFEKKLGAIQLLPGFHGVNSIGIIRDADLDASAAFQNICSVVQLHGFIPPPQPLVPNAGIPKITVLIIPCGQNTGMLENVCLESVCDDPVMECVDRYFQCLEAHNRKLSEYVIPKARVRAFLASREWLEIEHFECLEKCEYLQNPVSPKSPSVVVPRAHVFLSSRYSPTLSLGLAAKKTDREDRYWDFNHQSFQGIKDFLNML